MKNILTIIKGKPSIVVTCIAFILAIGVFLFYREMERASHHGNIMQHDEAKPSQEPQHEPNNEKKNFPPLKKRTIHLKDSLLEINTPFDLKESEPPNVNALVKGLAFNQSIVKTGNNDEVWIIINGFSINNKKYEAENGHPFIPNLDGSLSGAVEAIRLASYNMKKDIKEVKIESRKEVILNGMEGWEIVGDFINYDGKKMSLLPHFQGLAFSKGDDIWDVLIGCKKDDKNGEELIKIITDSIKILKKEDKNKEERIKELDDYSKHRLSPEDREKEDAKMEYIKLQRMYKNASFEEKKKLENQWREYKQKHPAAKQFGTLSQP